MAEDYIHHIATDWQGTIHAILSLADDAPEDFIKAVQYLLGNQHNKAREEIKRFAIEIDRLGFNSQAFLREKLLRFEMIQKESFILIQKATEGTDNSWVKTVFTVHSFDDSNGELISTEVKKITTDVLSSPQLEDAETSSDARSVDENVETNS